MDVVNGLLMIIGVCIGFASAMVFIFFCIDWHVHRSMVKDYCKEWDYVNFTIFLNEFEETKWETQAKNSEGLFNRNEKSQIHASIIQFRGKGMVLYPWSWVRFKIFERKHIYKQTRVKGLWA